MHLSSKMHCSSQKRLQMHRAVFPYFSYCLRLEANGEFGVKGMEGVAQNLHWGRLSWGALKGGGQLEGLWAGPCDGSSVGPPGSPVFWRWCSWMDSAVCCWGLLYPTDWSYSSTFCPHLLLYTSMKGKLPPSPVPLQFKADAKNKLQNEGQSFHMDRCYHLEILVTM